MECQVTSGFNVEGFKIVKYCDFVTSRQIFSGISFVKRNDKSDDAWNLAVNSGLDELKEKTQALGANAVIGLRLECVEDSPLVILVLTGTAVTIEPI